MCESYVEPFLFLTAILMGVLLNDGTNIIFKSVSNITSSICAILQMALSMDYSIMLINRYRQEREKEADKVTAMKRTMANAFTSISSSSVTTIVGLLVLVFMSFKIGKDLGLVLAKGVMFSLICILFVLPSLILIFDKAIEKTRKKAPNINLEKLGKASYKCRYIAVPLFLLVFLFSYLEKGNLGILYTDTQSDEVSKTFAPNNQIALIYKNEDEDKIAKYLKDLENIENVDEVLGYSNTINEELKYNELVPKMKDLGSDVEVDDYLLQIIYYNYYNQDENNTMTFNEFVNFVKNDVYKNPKVADKIDQETRKNVDRLENFTNANLVNKKRNASDIANIMEIDASKVNDILIYYNSKHNTQTIGLDEFIKFMNSEVLTNAEYSKKIDNSSRTKLNKLAKFTNKTIINKKMTSGELANLVGIDKEKMDLLYTYYISINPINTKMTLGQFSDFVLNNVIKDSQYAKLFNDDTIKNIKILNTFSNPNVINKNMTSTELANTIGIDENSVKQLLLLKYKDTDNGTRLTIPEFIQKVTQLQNTSYLQGQDLSMLQQLGPMISQLPPEQQTARITATELSKMIQQITQQDCKKQICNLYAVIDLTQNNTANWNITPNQLVKLILQNKSNPAIQENLNESTINQLLLLSKIMDSGLNNAKYTYSELADFIGLDAQSIKNIYTLYTSKNTELKLTPYEFVNFVLQHKNDSALAGNFNNATLKDLTTLQSAMSGVLNNKKYNSQELSNLLGINKKDLDLIYGLYTSKRTNTTISLKEFVEFLKTDVMQNGDYSSNFDETSKNKINTIYGIINASIQNVKYTKNEIFGIMSKLTDNLDKNKVDLVYMYYGSNDRYNSEWTMTIEKFVDYIDSHILQDSRFNDFIEDDMRKDIQDAKETINDARKLLIGNEYSRIVLNTHFAPESEETFKFIQELKDKLGEGVYVIGNSPMAYEMSKTFNDELNYITILTIIAIFVVVAITFKSVIIPIVLVLTIQCAVFLTMGILSLSGESVYFISILIVQSILMGATIDYAILYTSYYVEHRKTMGVKDAIINSYNKSINTILTSALILSIVTLVVGHFASAIAAKICKTLSRGTICSSILILLLLPAVIAAFDKVLIKNKDRFKK